MWFQQILRTFFFTIDGNLFRFISTVYDLLIQISRSSILTQGQIREFADRIQVFLGVFMLFKVAFSLITYIVNPDEFSDKSKGFAKLWQNAIISLIILVLTPYAFNMAYELQGMLLEENTLATIIFEQDADKNYINNSGDLIAYSVMIPFFTPNTSNLDLNNCESLITNQGEMDNDCYESMYSVMYGHDSKQKEVLIENYKYGIENYNLGLTFRLDLAKETMQTNGGEQFVIDYNPPISTAVAVVVLLLLITFCMDVALRSVKLAFLQLISPIPIISYIDPKSGKDGIFKKWYQMCFSTYLSLFVRLLALYLGIYIINKVNGIYDLVNGSTISNGWVKIFIIIGVLMFAKQLPKILEGLGIKLDGGGKFTLNPFKKFGDEAFGGKQILGAGAAVGAGALAGGINVASRLPRALNAGRNLFRRETWLNEDGRLSFGSVMRGAGRSVHGMLAPVRSGIGGAFGGTFRGFSKTVRGEKAGKIFTDSLGEAMFAKIQREDLNRKGSTWVGRRLADIGRLTGNLNADQQQELELAELDAEHKKRTDAIKVESEKIQNEKAELNKLKNQEKRILSDRNTAYSNMKSRMDTYKSPGRVEFHDENGVLVETNINVKDADEYVKTLQQNNEYYIKEGESFKDENGLLRTATAEDVAKAAAKGYLSEKGRIADETLKEERKKAFQYLSQMDDGFKQNLTIVRDSGETANSYDQVKSGEINSSQAIKNVDTKYFQREKDIETAELEIADAEKKNETWYKQEIQNRGLDKESAEWIGNAADNAARAIKSSQPEGWKGSATVDSSSYSYDPRLGNFNPTSHGGNGGPPPPPRGNP